MIPWRPPFCTSQCALDRQFGDLAGDLRRARGHCDPRHLNLSPGLYCGIYVRSLDDPHTVSLLQIQSAPSQTGPWSVWFAGDVSAAANDPWYSQTRPYTPPFPTTCFRARLADATSKWSLWSVTKCMSSAPAATNVQVQGGSSIFNVYWFDHSQYDTWVTLQVFDANGRWLASRSRPGDGAQRGWRNLLEGASKGNVMECFRILTTEAIPGPTFNPWHDFGDSVPINTATSASDLACGYPYAF